MIFKQKYILFFVTLPLRVLSLSCGSPQTDSDDGDDDLDSDCVLDFQNTPSRLEWINENKDDSKHSVDFTAETLCSETSLDMGGQEITQIPQNAFNGLSKLETLQLYKNSSLTTLPDNVFSDLSSLTKLGLADLMQWGILPDDDNSLVTQNDCKWK